VDLVEEVARHYGYDKFPPRLPAAKLPARRLPSAAAQDRLRERVVALGYQEIVEIPLVDPVRDALFRPEGIAPAMIGNPLAEDASVMRSTGIVSMLGALEWNLNHGQRDLRLFEIGSTYQLRNGEPVETRVLTLGATGLARAKSIYGEAREFAFADFKGDLDGIGLLAGGFSWQGGAPAYLSGACAARISAGPGSATTNMGIAGQLARPLAERFKLRQEIFVAEFSLDSLLSAVEAAHAALRFRPLPRFPAVERDFSLLLGEKTTFNEVDAAVRSLGIAELQAVEPADLMTREQAAQLAREQKKPALADLVPAGKYSLMIRVKFQSAQATLTEAQLADFSSRIVDALSTQLGAALR
ncbi:MAG: hypothetical protein ACREQC_17375, partial [Candidatus Binataceae bacterium]